jgi:hypothetical protein
MAPDKALFLSMFYSTNPDLIADNHSSIRKRKAPVMAATSIKTLSLIQSQYVRSAQKPLDFWAFSHFGAPKERCPATLYL